MYCVRNYNIGTEKSLWIAKDCSKYELRDGHGDLTEHLTYETKLRAFRRLYYKYYKNIYQFSFVLNNTRTVYTAEFQDINNSLYLIFKTLGMCDSYYIVPLELLTYDLSDTHKFLDNQVIYFYLQDLFFNKVGVHLGNDDLRNYLVGGCI